eukprot:TRINITY_DN2712_c0_g2_i1.p1 TRINITY_DN2712_c0_g2~~TRINITY_DN2712_c0_g2_i1.p1  ORF type:complete len:648 (+),score=171.48 TRINITY_DN2712_c0_g2_i1:104-2047(+)
MQGDRTGAGSARGARRADPAAQRGPAAGRRTPPSADQPVQADSAAAAPRAPDTAGGATLPPPPSLSALNDLRRQQGKRQAMQRRAASQRSRSPGVRSQSPGADGVLRRQSSGRSPVRGVGPPRCSPLRSTSPSAPLPPTQPHQPSRSPHAHRDPWDRPAEQRSVSPMLKGISRSMVDNFGIDPGDLTVYKDDANLLGSGGFGKVYRGDYQATEVAVKVASMDRSWTKAETDEWKLEVQIMTKLRHPNILMLLGAVFETDSLAIVTELCAHGTLLQVLFEARGTKPGKAGHDPFGARFWQTRIGWLRDIALGMAFLHHKRIFHRDLKPSNVFVAQGGIPKIADFGLSRIRRDLHKGPRAELHGDEVEGNGAVKRLGSTRQPGGRQQPFIKENSRIQGTFAFIAPEVWAETPYTEKGDVYSFGVTAIQVLMLDVPFERDTRKELSWRIMKNRTRPKVPPALGGQLLPATLRELVARCISFSPADRPYFTGVADSLRGELRERYAAAGQVCPWPLSSELRNPKTGEDPLAEDDPDGEASWDDDIEGSVTRSLEAEAASGLSIPTQERRWWTSLSDKQRAAMRRVAQLAAPRLDHGSSRASRKSVEPGGEVEPLSEEESRARAELAALKVEFRNHGPLERYLMQGEPGGTL